MLKDNVKKCAGVKIITDTQWSVCKKRDTCFRWVITKDQDMTGVSKYLCDDKYDKYITTIAEL
jgi:hypothetical protein